MPNRIRMLVATLPMIVAASGCLYEATIDAKGGAELKIHYRVDPQMKPDRVGTDLQSSDVKLVSKSIDKNHYVDATLRMADVTKLSTAPFFRTTAVTLVDGPEKGTKKLTITSVNKTPGAKIPPTAVDYYGSEIKVVLHLPGDVVASNATESKGPDATWVFDTKKFFAPKENVLEVTYRLAH